KLRHPSILGQMIKVSSSLSATAQTHYLTVLETLVGELRTQLEENAFLRTVEINHRKVWDSFKGKKLGFIDGGVAALSALGSAPIAIRVGSYSVIPGVKGEDREHFKIE